MKVFFEEREPYLMHLPGLEKAKNKRSNILLYIFKYIKNNKLEIDEDITLIPLANKPYFENSLLKKQIESNNLNYLIPESCYKTTKWFMPNKSLYAVEALSQVKTKYALIVDVTDVLLLRSFDKTFIEKFNSFGADGIFNSSWNPFPNFWCYKIPDFPETSIRKQHNAGVVFGKTDVLLRFYQDYYQLLSAFPNIINEQFFTKLILRKGFYNITIDSKQELLFCNNLMKTSVKKTKDGLELIPSCLKKQDLSLKYTTIRDSFDITKIKKLKGFTSFTLFCTTGKIQQLKQFVIELLKTQPKIVNIYINYHPEIIVNEIVELIRYCDLNITTEVVILRYFPENIKNQILEKEKYLIKFNFL